MEICERFQISILNYLIQDVSAEMGNLLIFLEKALGIVLSAIKLKQKYKISLCCKLVVHITNMSFAALEFALRTSIKIIQCPDFF